MNFFFAKKMQEYLNDLRTRSNNEDQEAQIILFFKLYFDSINETEAIELCCKFRTTNLLLDGMCYFIGLKNNNRRLNEQNYQKSFEIFECLAEKNENNQLKYYAWYMIGVSYRCGRGVAVNSGRARKYFEKAAKKDNEWANYSLGMLYKGICIYTANKHFEKAAQQYNSLAIRQLAALYATKRYHPPDTKILLDLCLMMHPLKDGDLKCIKLLLTTGHIAWDFKYHKYWPDLYDDHRDIHLGKTHKICKFRDQVVLLLLISKHRRHSHFVHTSCFSRLVAYETIKQLAGLWTRSSGAKF